MMDKMNGLGCVTVIVLLLLEEATFQTVFQAEDLVWKSFSGCCGEDGCQKPGSPNYYRYLSISEDGNNLWVGAMNFLFKLDLETMACKKSRRLNVSDKKILTCKVQGKSAVPDCQNHIRAIIELNSEDLFVCGTGAYSPVNYTLDRRDISGTDQNSGVAMCPYDPFDNVTAIKIDQGNPWNSSALYFGTYTDFIKNFPAFFRPGYVVDGVKYQRKTTDSEDTNWLFAPQFVSSFDEEDSVFFFFREIGVETPEDDRKIFSRVGKVCKKDEGAGQLDIAKSKWLSFQKARLNCSLPGNVPFYFDDLYDVYRSGDYYYALFYKQAGFLSASAICIYKKSDIVQVFRGKFLHMDGNDNWVTLQTDPSPRLDNCSLYETDISGYEGIKSRYQLMDSTVRPIFGQPIFSQQGEQLMKIVVGQTSNRARNIYVASDKGKIYDIFFKEGLTDQFTDSVVKLNKVYEPYIGTQKSYAVWNMKLLDDALLLGTDYNVTRLMLEVCNAIQTIDTCIMDTRCVWNKCIKKCVSNTVQVESNCNINHTSVTPDKPMLQLLIEKQVVDQVREVQRQGIVGIYTTLEIVYPISRRTSRWKRSLPDQPEVELEMDRFVFKYAFNSKGDLMIANTTYDDIGRYKAYDQDNNLIADYQLDVIGNTEDLIDAWKQQFSDWSMAFVKWKSCSHDYFEGCWKRP